jgi:signal transduction histidine kinase
MADDAGGLGARVAAARDAVTRAAGARVAGIPSRVFDIALVVVALPALVAERIVAAPELDAPLPVALALAAVIAGSLGVGRRAPLAAYLAGSAALVVESLWVLPSPLSPYPNLIGLYFLGHYASRERALWGPVIALPGILAYFAPSHAPAAASAGVLFVWLLAWAAGYSGARRRERLERDRRLLRREAITDERGRIARELHDVIGHTVNVMLVQAGAGRTVLTSDPEQARELLIGVERTGREALDELDRVLGVLRTDDGADLQPGVAELPRLIGRMAAAGLAVTVRVDQSAGQLPRTLDLSVYRIVQEALTNALRHGRAGSATVTVHRAGAAVRVEVCDDGRGPIPGYQPGRGLLGITERASVFAGSVEHGGGEGGGFRLRAVLPLP